MQKSGQDLILSRGAHNLDKYLLKSPGQLKLENDPSPSGIYVDICQAKLNGGKVTVMHWRTPPISENTLKQFITRLRRALDVWGTLDHPNIALFIGIVMYPGRLLPALIVPSNQGSIADYLRENPSTKVLPILVGIAAAVGYMHGRSLVHGDINGFTVIMDDRGVPCLSNIGTSTIAYRPDWATPNRDHSVRWMAPELLKGDAINPTPASDVWSFGMAALQLFSGDVPYAHRRRVTSVFCDIQDGVKPSRPLNPEVTDETWEVINSCWKEDPAERPSMDLLQSRLRLLSHPLYAEVEA